MWVSQDRSSALAYLICNGTNHPPKKSKVLPLIIIGFLYDVLITIVENSELKTLLYLLNPTVHKEKKQNKIKWSNELYNFKVKVSLNRK